MGNNFKVTVITVCYNSEDFIENTIRSVFIQTYQNIEYIIIDGNSTDKTLDILNKYKNKISKIISEDDNGIYDAMNKGIKVSSGGIVYFLNSDDIFCDKWVVEDVVREFIMDSDIELIYGKIFCTDLPKGSSTRSRTQDLIISKKSDFLKQGFAQQRIFFKRELFNKVGLFSTTYKIISDFNWLLLAYDNRVAMHPIDRYIAKMYAQGTSHKQWKSAKKELLDIIKKNYSTLIYLWYLFQYYFWNSLKFRIRKFLNI